MKSMWLIFFSIVLVVVVGTDEHIFCEDGGMENVPAEFVNTDNGIGTLPNVEKTEGIHLHDAEPFAVSLAGVTIKVTKSDLNINIPLVAPIVIVVPLVLSLSMVILAFSAVVCAFYGDH